MWPIRFVHPVALLLVPVAVAAFVRWRRRLGGALTLGAAVCLAVAAARPQWATTRRRVARLYVVDASGSTFLDVPAALGAVRASMADLAPEDQAGLVLFGASPLLAIPLTEVRLLPRRLDAPAGLPPPDGSDLAAALHLAARQLADGAVSRQIVVLSDGRDTSDRAAIAAASLADRGIRVHCIPVAPTGVVDARVARIAAPPHVRAGEPFPVTIELSATAPLSAEVTLSRGDVVVARKTMELDGEGIRRLAARDRLSEPGSHVYTARLAAADRCEANNVARAVVDVEGAIGVLCVSSKAQPPIAHLLRGASGLRVTTLSPAAARLDAEGLAAADVVILDDVAAALLGAEAHEAIRRWVRDGAGGLIALGGPASYGPGGYRDTPIEAALPVDCARPRPIALVAVLDKSGSMAQKSEGRQKIAFARDAVLQALGRLRPQDRFALIAFDAKPTLHVPLASGPDPARVRRLLDGITPHGPTDVQNALERSLAVFGDSASADAARHIILVSDGQDQRFDATGLAARCQAVQATLSVLMTGTDPTAIARLRELAGDRFHRVTDLAALPAIFARALLQAIHGQDVQTGTFAVRASASPEIAAEAPGALAGYVRTAAKPTASVEWSTASGDPVLARWRHGLGRSVAFTSTVGTEWDRGMLPAQAVAQLWQRAIRWAARPRRSPGFEAEAAVRGDALELTVRAERQGRFLNGLELTARVVPPEGDAVTVELPQQAPGEYGGRVAAPMGGIYSVAIVADGSPRLSISVAKNSAREWEAFGLWRAALDTIARNGRGRVLERPADLGSVAPEAAVGHTDIDHLAVALALLLFVADVARRVLRVRRLRL